MKTQSFGWFDVTDRMYIREVFYWFDALILFTAEYKHPEFGKVYLLGLAVADGKYLFATMSRKRCVNVENNVTSIRQQLIFPNGRTFNYRTAPHIVLATRWSTGNFADPFQRGYSKDDVREFFYFPGGFRWNITRKEQQQRRRKRK